MVQQVIITKLIFNRVEGKLEYFLWTTIVLFLVELFVREITNYNGRKQDFLELFYFLQYQFVSKELL